MTYRNVPSYLHGDLTRKTMLFILVPLILISYFGILGLAVWLYPESYDWRYISISKLLYPRNNPEFHYIASIGVALTGVLMIPFAGYIHRRLRRTAPAVATFGTLLFFGGCICLTLAGLIASHPAHGVSRLPKLHEILARISVIGIGVGTLMFTVCATRGYFRPNTGRPPYRRGLVISWNLLTMPALLIIVAWLLIRIFLKKSAPAHHVIVTSAAWNLGFWEWIGSVAVVAFLASAALFLPENNSD
jgi:hypothetical protein